MVTYNISLVRRFILIVNILCLPLLVLAQAPSGVKVTGKLAAPTGEKLEFATTSLLRAADSGLVKTVVSDGTGSFLFENIPGGSYILHVSLIGYKPIHKPVDISAAAPATDLGALVMETNTKTIKEVVVAGKKPLIERRLDKTVMNIENSLLSTGSTALELLQLAPGVTLTNSDKVQLNGKNSPMIMIDGKPTYLSDAQLSNVLKGMPSNMISEIEIISQPSAKYDAAGTAGVINIKTKQNKSVGFNGSITGGLGYGSREKYRGGINLNYKGSKVSLSGDYSYSFNHSIRDLDIDRYVPDETQTNIFNRHGQINNKLGSNNYRASAIYSINKNHSIGAQLIGYSNDQQSSTGTVTKIHTEKTVLDSLMRSGATEKAGFNSLGGNINYRGKLDTLGTELSFDGDYSKFKNNSNRYFTNTLYDPNNNPLGIPDQVRNNFPTNIKIVSLKTDLVVPLKHKAKLEAGLKSSFVTTDNDAQYDSLLNEKWTPSLSQSNHFVYKENVNAGYLNYRKDWKNTSIQGGLRVENTNADGNSITLDQRNKRSYTDLFPSAFISQKLSGDNTVMLSYSRRIERPSYQDLNPFRFYDDRYTYSEGNPFLKPAYTNSIEFTWSWKNEITTVLRYGVTNDVIAEDIQQDPQTNVTKSLLRNLNQMTSYSAAVSYSKDITKWWSMDNTITLNRSAYKDDNLGYYRNFNNYNYNINIYNSFKIVKGLSADLGGFYLSPWLYGFIKANAQYKLDVGLKKDLWKKKASLKLKVSDIFNTNHFEGTGIYQDNVKVNIINHFESRVAFVTFTYLLGNNKLKVAKRSEGNADEKDRIKKGQ